MLRAYLSPLSFHPSTCSYKSFGRSSDAAPGKEIAGECAGIYRTPEDSEVGIGTFLLSWKLYWYRELPGEVVILLLKKVLHGDGIIFYGFRID